MNSNWHNRPTTIDEVPRTINWIIAIDESGSSDLKFIKRAVKEGRDIGDGDRQFTVTACAIKTDDFEASRDLVMQVKNKYWENALYNYKGTQKRICFHSKDIRGKRGAFNPDLIDYSSFIADISDMMKNVPISISETYIPGTRKTYKVKYICKKCGNVTYRYETKDIKNI